jgi:hypothetical protein
LITETEGFVEHASEELFCRTTPQERIEWNVSTISRNQYYFLAKTLRDFSRLRRRCFFFHFG